MSIPITVDELRAVIDEVANALQVLTLLVEHQELATRNAAQDSVIITRNLRRVVDSLKKVQPPTTKGGVI
jgi:hypothetical protein